jgi:hypothetical protein
MKKSTKQPFKIKTILQKLEERLADGHNVTIRDIACKGCESNCTNCAYNYMY